MILKKFETIQLGATLIKPDMSNINCWPNIYHDKEKYIKCNFEFDEIEKIIDELNSDLNFRKRLADNSQSILNEINSTKGK